MIPHSDFARPRFIRDAGSYFKLGLAILGALVPVGFTVKPDLGVYQLAGPVPHPEKPVIPFFAPVKYRGRDRWGYPKRVDPVQERRRMRGL